MGEYDSSGNLIQEHIWLGDRPVAVQTSVGLDYVHTDQLGTPRAVTDSSKTVEWSWGSDPFGNGQPTGSLTYNLRFPGQYYDAETGNNYNYMRDYDPGTGRYAESDPIGLRGGINTYVYVNGNSISNKDPTGTKCIPGIGCWTTPAEQALADSGQYQQYYSLACADGDAYACFAGHVAVNDNFWGHLATNRLNNAFKAAGKHPTQCDFEKIRIDLAKDYANYLPNSLDNAQWPNANAIAQFHQDEFAQFGLPPSTFGGTPFAPAFGPFMSGIWCPNCR